MGLRKKKQKKVDSRGPDRDEEGDAWVYTCIKRNTYLFAAFSIGKWTQETCENMISKLSERTRTPNQDTRIEFYTDGNDDYTWVLPEHYNTSCTDYGQIIKIREKGRVVDKKKVVIYGRPEDKDIETTDVENFNGILRERIGRLVRKTKCFSKYKRRLCCAVHVFQFYWNFMNEFRRGKTPAMLEGLSEALWDWERFLRTPLTIIN